ncbi:MAG: hypothetical protein RR842_11030 [Gordonibacter sp.]|uniref:hypothetical protein n=1 Tax=Gordonibacter sp. TaxID=1968902 RepID=UPI002FCB9DAB
MSFESKRCVAEAFASLASSAPVDKITVGMVAELTGKHRKTFYYHFTDKREVIVWLFRYDLSCGLMERFDEAELVFEEDAGAGTYPALPFYVRNLQQGGRMYNAPFFDEVSRSLERRRAYYRNVLSHHSQGSLEDYLYRLYQPEIKRDIGLLIECRLEGEDLIDQADELKLLTGGAGVDFLAEMFTGTFIQRIVKRLIDEPAQRSLDEVRPFENIVHDSLALLINRALELRSLRP